MAILEGVEVRVQCNGEFLTEYNDPEAESGRNECRQVKYIEAVPNATFSIRMNAKPGFNYEGANSLNVMLQLDNNKPRYYFMRRKSSQCLAWTHQEFLCERSGQWKKSKFAFGSVEAVEDNDGTNETILKDPSKLKKLGTINLEVVRSQLKKLARPEFPIFKRETRITTIPEKLLKGASVTNSIKAVEETVTSAIRWDYGCVNLPGRGGRRFSFTFIYRSRAALQSLGCVPRDPSPEVQTTEDSEPTDAKPTQTTSEVPDAPISSEEEAELERLRARLTYLEDKRTSTNAGSQGNLPIKRERSNPVKRERSIEETDSNGKRRKVTRVPGVIDLTGD